jgi:hypothetical protein
MVAYERNPFFQHERRLRNIIKNDLKTHFDDFDALYKFGKTKGWERRIPLQNES